MTSPPPQPKTISHLFDAVYPSFAMLAGLELDLFSHLATEPRTSEQLAGAMGMQAIKLRPLLYALVVADLLTVNDERFANTPEANHYLVKGKPDYLGGLTDLTSSNWANLLKTAATIRAGGPPDKYDYHGTSDELVGLFRGLYGGAVADANMLMDQHDFSTHKTLLDVGGGSGALAITLAQTHPNLHATVADLPSIIPITRQFIEEANATGQVHILSADAVRERLSGAYDVIVARHVIQVLSAEDSRALLRNLAAVLNPGGVIHLIGWVLDNSRLTPRNTVGYNLILLTGYDDGQAYTEQEYYEWLAEAGFSDFERVVKPDGASILTAYKQ